MMAKTVGVFGSTGSIGTQLLSLLEENLISGYEVFVLTARSNVDLLVAQAKVFTPQYVVVTEESAVSNSEVEQQLPEGTTLLVGSEHLAEMASLVDVSVNGIVGFAGLPVTIASLEAGKRLALANKESLVAAGSVVQKARLTPGAEIIPVDSEHAAIHQCLRSSFEKSGVQNLQLTASGGPFRSWTEQQLLSVSVEDALAHPTWSMGAKITVDSSTLMNKGLEVIEAFELFGEPAGDRGYGLKISDIEVVVHPQSIVHSMVTYCDGSTIAKLSDPDMRIPLGYALAYPERWPIGYGVLDWSKAMKLEFEPPDLKRFPCLELAYAAGKIRGTAPAIVSAANEVAVEAFLQKRIRWVDIYKVIEKVFSSSSISYGVELGDVLEADAKARSMANQQIGSL